jgi:hypothetical protein
MTHAEHEPGFREELYEAPESTTPENSYFRPQSSGGIARFVGT